MLKSLFIQLQLSVYRKESRAMLYYHLGRIHGYTYADTQNVVNMAIKNESNFLVNDYATRHGAKNV